MSRIDRLDDEPVGEMLRIRRRRRNRVEAVAKLLVALDEAAADPSRRRPSRVRGRSIGIAA
jgi:hypothetical protein